MSRMPPQARHRQQDCRNAFGLSTFASPVIGAGLSCGFPERPGRQWCVQFSLSSTVGDGAKILKL